MQQTSSADGRTSQTQQTELQYQFLQTKDEAKKAMLQLLNEKPSVIALDCEGLNLSRNGPITTLQVGTKVDAPVLIFDVKTLAKSAFDCGLHALLEDRNVLKLMFDCRKDSDALYHQFGVRLDGVQDLQLWDFLVRELQEGGRQPASPGMPRVPYLKGMLDCLPRYGAPAHLVNLKTDGNRILQVDRYSWNRRPLPASNLNYAAADIISILHLHAQLRQALPLEGNTKRRLQVASKRYCAYYRDFPEIGGSTKHLLPMYIMPECRDGVVDYYVPSGRTQCDFCRRRFPCRVLHYWRYRKLCPVCKELERLDNFHRRRRQ